MKKYPYWVRHNGIDYAPGTDVPVDEVPGVNAPGEQVNQPDSADDSQNTDKGADAATGTQEMSKEEFIKTTKGFNKAKLAELVEKYNVDIDVTNPENTNKIIHAKIVEKIYG